MSKSNSGLSIKDYGAHAPKGMQANSWWAIAKEAREKSKKNPVKVYTKEEIEAYKKARSA